MYEFSPNITPSGTKFLQYLDLANGWCLKLRNTNYTETVAVATAIWIVVVTIRYTTAARISIPATATQDTVATRRRTLWVGLGR